MKEFSEKELENAYRNIKMMEVPDMWEEIERNLAPKQTGASEAEQVEAPKAERTKALEAEQVEASEAERIVVFEKKRTHVRKHLCIAAMALLLILPVSYTMYGIYGGKDGSKSGLSRQELYDTAAGGENTGALMSDEASDAETTAESSEWNEAGEAGAEDLSSGMEADTENPENSGSAKDTGRTDSDGGTAGEAIPEEAKQDTSGEDHQGFGEGSQSSEKLPEVQLEVQVTEAWSGAEGLWIRAEVVKGDGGYRIGEEVEILYEGTAYTEEMLAGRRRLRLGKEEKVLKLLEILP